VESDNFKISSEDKKMVSNNMTFDTNGITNDLGESKKFIVGDYTSKDDNTIAGVFCDASTEMGNIRLLTSPADHTKSTELILETLLDRGGSDFARLYFGGDWTIPIVGTKSRPIVYLMGQYIVGRLTGDTPANCAASIVLDPDFDPEKIGTTGYPVTPNKYVRFIYNTSSSQLHLPGSGAIHFPLATYFDNPLYYTSLVQQSTKDIKHDIQEMDDMGEKIDSLSPVSFVYDNDPDEQRRYGLIYEDTEPVMPEICTGDEENKAINYVELIPVLLKEIQMLRQRVKALEEREV
jgi:hypothetical protein